MWLVRCPRSVPTPNATSRPPGDRTRPGCPIGVLADGLQNHCLLRAPRIAPAPAAAKRCLAPPSVNRMNRLDWIRFPRSCHRCAPAEVPCSPATLAHSAHRARALERPQATVADGLDPPPWNRPTSRRLWATCAHRTSFIASFRISSGMKKHQKAVDGRPPSSDAPLG